MTPDLLTIFAYVVPVPTELKQIAPGVINCVCAPVVITSDKTPEPGIGSTLICLDASAVGPRICSVAARRVASARANAQGSGNGACTGTSDESEAEHRLCRMEHDVG